jgi:hypothetical protein
VGDDKSGWYYEGTSNLRYHDGNGWTDQYKPSSLLGCMIPISTKGAS